MCQDDDITCNENSPDDLYEVAKHNMEKIQFSLQKIQHYEKEILNMSKKADLDIDDVLDFLLAKIMKLISKKKREMKVQVMIHFLKCCKYNYAIFLQNRLKKKKLDL